MKAISDASRIQELLDNLEYLSTHQVEIGVFGDDDSHLLMIARVHEFGCAITVTPKMRGYLHYMGLHLSPSTDTINIPERSYLRTGIDSNKDNIEDMVSLQLTKVLEGTASSQQVLEAVGIYVTGLIQNYITYLTDPPLHPFTIEQKGSSQPLIDIGRLRMSITWRIKKV